MDILKSVAGASEPIQSRTVEAVRLAVDLAAELAVPKKAGGDAPTPAANPAPAVAPVRGNSASPAGGKVDTFA